MPLRELYTKSLPGYADDELVPSKIKRIVSSCAWSDHGLLAISISGHSEDIYSTTSIAASPTIFIYYVDTPESHSVLVGGHDFDIFTLSWAPSHFGICLLSADTEESICFWRPVAGVINNWTLHHRLIFRTSVLTLWMNPSDIFLPPMNPPVEGKQTNSYEARYRKERISGHRDAQPAVPTDIPSTSCTDPLGRLFTRASGSDAGSISGVPPPAGLLCIVSVSRLGEARVFLETESCGRGSGTRDWASAGAKLCTREISDPTGNGEATVGECTMHVQLATGAVKDGALVLAVADGNQAYSFGAFTVFCPVVHPFWLAGWLSF